MVEEEVLRAIEDGETASGLLVDAIPGINRRWSRLCKSMVTLLADVRHEFPDAQYYTASGGFNLLLGRSHADDRVQSPQQHLEALGGCHGVSVGDGDY